MANELPEPKFLCGDSTCAVELTYREARTLCESRKAIVNNKIDKAVLDMENAIKEFHKYNTHEHRRGYIVRMEAIGNTLTSLLEVQASIPVPRHDDWEK